MDIHFLRPWWILALIPVLGLILFLLRHLKNADCWKQVIDPELFDALITRSNRSQHFFTLSILAVCWLMAIIALAGPAWKKKNLPLYKTASAKVILLDLSPAMLATDIPPNRLRRARYKVLDILNSYPEGQTGMAVFSREAYTVSPLTNDTHTIALMVPDLSPAIMPVIGSNIGAGLLQAERLLKQGEARRGEIILITASVPTKSDEIIAKRIHSDNYSISILGMGTAKGAIIPNPDFPYEQNNQPALSQLDIAGLEQLAMAGGGRFSTFTNTRRDIHYILDPSAAKSGQNALRSKSNNALWYDEGCWFIILILPFVLFSFRKGWFVEWLK